MAQVRRDDATVQDAVVRYGARYGRTPAPDPERVVIWISVDRALGQTLGSRPQMTQAAA
ncbi:hypothetical protein ACIRF8_05035 [Streptomyces sp. NPDC102406]|uniref:hypothetical protein n=1 Tax=Streptomyces sp. NPDC102406 TaxID=3366171 RepID=UPI003811E3DF